MLNIRIEQEFDLDSPVKPSLSLNMFSGIARQMSLMLGVNKNWYEKGGARKQALQYQVFTEEGVSEATLSRWEKRYKKNYPFFGEGIWDGGSDEDSACIDLTSSYSSTSRRKNPMSLVIEFSINPISKMIDLESALVLVKYILSINGCCSYLNVESEGYSFPELILNGDGHIEVFKKVFPDRISCGWMLYVPYVLLPGLIPEAARVVPIMSKAKQKGTIVVSTEEIFDGNNKEHIAKSNDIEIRLLDLGYLPLITEL